MRKEYILICFRRDYGLYFITPSRTHFYSHSLVSRLSYLSEYPGVGLPACISQWFSSSVNNITSKYQAKAFNQMNSTNVVSWCKSLYLLHVLESTHCFSAIKCTNSCTLLLWSNYLLATLIGYSTF